MLTRPRYPGAVPKLIDHDQRREEIAEATWQVILAQGISAVSIRTVAAQAGISTGSLRHVLPSKSDLLVASIKRVEHRARARVQRHLDEPDPRRRALAVLCELLPLDAERRAELEVTIALVAEAPGDRRIRRVRDENYEVVLDACRRTIDRLRLAGLTAPGLDTEQAAITLHALIDGLAVHLLVNPAPAFRHRALRVVEAFIDDLARESRRCG